MWPGPKKPSSSSPPSSSIGSQRNGHPQAPARPGALAAQAFAGFEEFQPDAELAKQEAPGNVDWKGGSLPFIPAEHNLAFVDLPARLVQLVQHCWTAASVSEDAQRSGLQIGAGSRVNHIPDKINQLKSSFNPKNILEAKSVQERNNPYAKQVAPLKEYDRRMQEALPYLGAVVPNDWKVTEQMERVNAYTFRGDRRDPKSIHAAGGFHPPITRTDSYYVDTVIFPMFRDYMKRRFNVDITRPVFQRVYNQQLAFPQDRMVMANFFVWRSMVEGEAYHVGRMLANETLKGYISTTRAVPVAKGFARVDGWVYLTLIRGGFLVPDRGKHEWTTIFGEQEIAFPGAVSWDDIFGFRQVNDYKKFTGPIYLRQGLAGRNPTAFQQVLKLFSGQVQ